MFNSVKLRGPKGSVVWSGTLDAAELTGWTITKTKKPPEWGLRARVVRVDSFRIKQTPLFFTAPRTSRPRGLWFFPIVPSSVLMAGGVLTARLGPPEG